MKQWYVAVNGQQQGPFDHNFVLQNIASGQYNPTTMVWTQGFSDWTPISQVNELKLTTGSAAPPPPSSQAAHEIDYTIHGNEMQFVEIELDPQESA